MTFRLTPAMSAALRTGRSPVVPIVEAALPGYTLRHVVGSIEVPWRDGVFRGRDPLFGVLDSAGNLTDGVADEAPDWTLNFAPPDPTSGARLAAASAQGGAVSAWLGVIDRESGRLLPDPIQVFAGELDYPTLRAGKGTLTIEWRCVSALEVFHDQEIGARVSDSWHQLVWPGETGCANMTGIERTSYWGVEKPPSNVTVVGGSTRASFLANIGLS